MSAPLYITTVLGDSRPVQRFYEDGSFDCPWCGSAVVFPKRQCENPACDSCKYWTESALLERREREAARLAEEARRKRDHELTMERIKEEKARRLAWQKEQFAEAEKRGACLHCLFLPGWERVRFVKHRKTCPKMRQR